MQDLYAYLGGRAQTGARYKIEITRTASGGYAAHCANGGGSTAWSKLSLIAEDPELGPVVKAASTQFASKTKPGRDRTYSLPLDGGPDAGTFPKGVTVLPEHPLCWQTGRSLATLPRELHARAILSGTEGDGQDLGTLVALASPAPGTSPLRPSYGQRVQLCRTVKDRPTFETYLSDLAWLLTEKLEGHRAQLHRLEDRVALTNRSGEEIACPPHIAAYAMETLVPGISLDGEILTVDEQGTPQLYVGAQATVQLFVAFDLLTHDGGQLDRLRSLSLLVPAFEAPFFEDGAAIRVVAWAADEPAKRALVAEVEARQGEGWVLRRVNSAYTGVRSGDWLRFRRREAPIDVVVMGYRFGTGRLAQTVGAIEVGLYDRAGALVSIGWAGSGWSDQDRAQMLARWQRGETGYVVRVKSFGLSADGNMIRPSGVDIRPAGDKRPDECTIQSQVGSLHLS